MPTSGPQAAAVDEVDRRILAALRIDGRAPISRLATDVGAPAATVQRRVAQMRASGELRFEVDTDRARLGLGLRTLLWLTVAPAALMDTGRTLAGHPEVAFAAAVTGDRNLYVSVATADIAALFAYLTTRLATLPAVQSWESSLVLHTVKGS